MMPSMKGVFPLCLLSSSRSYYQLDGADDRYEKFFYGANDKFEVQRGLNNVFAYDLVPSVKVCEAALRACRRGISPLLTKDTSVSFLLPLDQTTWTSLIIVADYSTSVRIFEALREKTENKTQYDAYVNELKPVREELGMFLQPCHFCKLIAGILLKEEMWPGAKW
jgi:cytochrome c oxidase subunit 5a